MGRIYFATTNLKKLKEVRRPFNTDIVHMNVSMVEIQASQERVVHNKLDQVMALISKEDAVIVDDTGVFLDSLCGFPGVYIKDFLKIGSQKILEILKKVEDNNATVSYTLGIAHYKDGQIAKKAFSGEIKGTIMESKEEGSAELDGIFIPDEFKASLKSMSIDEKNCISHRRIATENLTDYMVSIGIIKASSA
ncbi:Ham1 nucleoside triphosphatase [Encephalitozoon romaleae SJ-2008]|uniref:Ham1 nucleoside triphosphatase n=1 Tax=Encephalitozoon romaleae (strain SJ-2008) TaxID=1178016 RepID=I6ZI36_ENCRO|nr:Ham1 nucleoside triphosphatase [Encephalitozoon romaleae SJ-2008]AFN82883.1 Ham1 nucleoside triphosphatase [Encephalitozoon romaleae SJ-2008]